MCKSFKLLVSSFFACLLFSVSAFAQTNPTYILKIIVNNPKAVPLTFINYNNGGNSCTSQGPNAIMCSITDLNVVNSEGLLAPLYWSNSKNQNCSITFTGLGKLNPSYRFVAGMSSYKLTFQPDTWDGKSNLSEEITIGPANTPGC